jgi:hypothetical protein
VFFDPWEVAMAISNLLSSPDTRLPLREAGLYNLLAQALSATIVDEDGEVDNEGSTLFANDERLIQNCLTAVWRMSLA